MNKDDLVKLHSALADFEQFFGVRHGPMRWDDPRLEDIRKVAIMIEREVSRMHAPQI